MAGSLLVLLCIGAFPAQLESALLKYSRISESTRVIAPWRRHAPMMPDWAYKGCEPISQSNPMRLFVGVGAMKSGTTSLFTTLKELRDNTTGVICLPVRKELNTWYYSSASERAGAEELDNYWGQFDQGSPECGRLGVDVSPSYMMVPYASLRLCELAPPGDVTLTALLRHPIDRLLSHYAHMDGDKHERLFRWQCKLEETLRQCAHADIPAMPNAPQIFTHIKLGKVGSSLPGIPSCFVHRCPLKRQGVLERYLAREIAALRACHTPTAVADPFHAHIVNPAYRACLSREGWEADGVPPVASPFSPSSVLRPHFWAFHEDPTDPALLVDWMLVSRGLYHEQLAWLFRFHPARQVHVYCSEGFYRDMPRLVKRDVAGALGGEGVGQQVASASLDAVQARPHGADVDDKPKLSPEAAMRVQEYYVQAGLFRGLHLLFGGHPHASRADNPARFNQAWADACGDIWAYGQR